MNLKDILLGKLETNSAYKRLFDQSNPDARAVLKDLMRVSGFGRTTFVIGDPHKTSFNEGQRAIVLGILRQISKDQKEIINNIEEKLHESLI